MAREKVIPINASVENQESAEENMDTKPEKRQRERISVMERRPSPDALVSRRIEGRRVWFARVEATGMNPHWFGPFKTRHQSLLFLDDAANQLADALIEAENKAQDRIVRIPFFSRTAHFEDAGIELPRIARKGR